MRLSWVGTGAVGQALGRRLAEAGHPVEALYNRTAETGTAARAFLGEGRIVTDPAEAARGADAVWITTPDRAIAEAADLLMRRGALSAGQWVVHCSGALPAEVLAPARRAGCFVASFHPLVSIPDPAEGLRRLQEPFHVFLEGDEPAVKGLTALAREIGARPVRLKPGTKTLYHAAAVAASNYVVVLLGQAMTLLEEAGVPADEARAALSSLARSAVANVERLGPEAALTGPVARGDAEIVRDHRRILEARTEAARRGTPPADPPEETLALYDLLARQAIRMAQRRGSLSDEAAAVLRRVVGSGPLQEKRRRLHSGAR